MHEDELTTPGVTHEEERVEGRIVLAVIAGTILFSLFLSLLAWQAVVRSERAARPSGNFPERQYRIAPEIAGVERTLFGTAMEGPALARAQRARLDGFGWVDRGRGVVHIPVDAAIDLLVAREGER